MSEERKQQKAVSYLLWEVDTIFPKLGLPWPVSGGTTLKVISKAFQWNMGILPFTHKWIKHTPKLCKYKLQVDWLYFVSFPAIESSPHSFQPRKHKTQKVPLSSTLCPYWRTPRMLVTLHRYSHHPTVWEQNMCLFWDPVMKTPFAAAKFSF